MRTPLLTAIAWLALSSAASAATYYVAPTGDDAAAGSQRAPWKSFAKAQSVAAPGDTVYFRGGRYAYTDATTPCASRTSSVDGVSVSKSGREGAPIRYFAYEGETPVFDFSGMKNDCRIRGFHVSASWIHLRGLEEMGVPQNNNLNHESWGVWITGSHNIFERLNLHHNMGPGLFIAEGGHNLVLNSDSHRNFDPLTSNGAGESADGFGAHSKAAGGEGNVFRGNRAWMNADDGFDLINTNFPVVIENSWAWQNGYLPDSMTGIGNGNGFKMGGFGGRFSTNAVKHTLRNSVAFNNRAAGVYANHHPIANDYFNNTSFGNGSDYNMRGIDTAGKVAAYGNMRNNIALKPASMTYMPAADYPGMANNSWSLAVTVSDEDFESLSTNSKDWEAPRQKDGSLPVLKFARLKATSDLIDKGVDVALPFKGKAPDLGAFELK